MNTAPADIIELRNLSARLGRDPRLVQAASGNTSIKFDFELWIKASGKWLADASWDDIFVPVNRNTLEVLSGHLAPSIETAMHAALPDPVVIHVHSVNAISWAVREDGRSQLASRLAGLPWAWIPYVLSGLPLAREIQRAWPARVFVLANHGLVVCAKDCAAAEALLTEVECRLEASTRTSAPPDRSHLSWMALESGFHVPAELEVHCLGVDPDSLSIFTGGCLYPCHAMFLGPSSAECEPYESVIDACRRYELRYGMRPSNIAVRGKGLLVSDVFTVTQMQVLIGLANVIQRIERDAAIHYLSQMEISELMTTDAHRYRENVEARSAFAIR